MTSHRLLLLGFVLAIDFFVLFRMRQGWPFDEVVGAIELAIFLYLVWLFRRLTVIERAQRSS